MIPSVAYRRSDPMKKNDAVLDVLRKASKGLRYTSETEADLTPFVWENGGELTPDRLRQRAGVAARTPVEETTLDAFFRAVPSEDKVKFQELAHVLKDQLSDIKVYKLGEEAEKEVYIVGRTTDGRWAGLRTRVVET
jgi:Nuclease A inhibitor-like protein